ncbi:Fur-regulated basic protein FbpA [Alteribacillus bidgolensis]|uniref:Fur-regulated basic protein A n=1 Tax=Alteribacillus bidgolensis TaxID=930129 RepID=A0A1G8HCI2_9BACI|nr:Fur-regulated basic protein FbpA [Alteribacillus bidgolensis]SDI04322.1 Fur-regulated basic protein A [Alteribacillus bidgolensis]
MNMCTLIDEKNKDQLIAALLDLDIYKMPDGRQFYEATESELKNQFLLRTNYIS